MKKNKRRRPRSCKVSKTSKQKTMDDNYYSTSSTSYLVESFSLNSCEREVSRRGKGKGPDPSYRRDKKGQTRLLTNVARQCGRKVRNLDLTTLTLHFDNYVKAVNLILTRIYQTNARAQKLGETLSVYRGRAYNLLRQERDLCYQHNDAIKELVFERLHRNVLEHAGRTLLSNWTRRQLFTAAIQFLSESPDDALRLLRWKHIPSDLIRRVRDSCSAVKKNGSGYHYCLGVLRQLRLAIDSHILDSLGVKISWRGRQRKRVASLLMTGSSDLSQVVMMVEAQLKEWVTKGYPFTIPRLRSYSLDFSASTENSTGQGYWFSLDEEREDEILLHLKLPPGIDGTHHEDSPYKSRALTFRFLDWLPRAARSDRGKAARTGDAHRAERLIFRAAKFEDMHDQLMNTIKFQHMAHRLSRLRLRKDADTDKVKKLEQEVHQLRGARRSAPPRVLLRGHRVTLQIPFHSPNGVVSSRVFGGREYSTKAGIDRGLRAPVALSVETEGSFKDLLITVDHLVQKRERVRKHAYVLTSEVTRKKNNWDKKRSGQSYPVPVLKQDRHIEALWRKVRRLDREIARIVASRTVWFCEEHRVKKVFFEDLRSFQGHAGSKDLSYNLTSNLWGKIIDTVRYMRESLGHSKYSVWTVNPRYTSQTCHVCGERGVRVEDETSTTERKGGEYFYCMRCNEHHHADVNAARNIIHVQDSSAVPGRTACPTYNERLHKSH
ncbi:MAG: transposase [Candidatus Thorarchaeota archaeon]